MRKDMFLKFLMISVEDDDGRREGKSQEYVVEVKT